MPTLNIDGVGKVEVGAEFLSMSPERQASEVDAIASQIRPRTTATPGPAAGPGSTAEQLAPQFGEQADAAAAFANRKPTDVVERGTLLPIGKTAGGDVTLAVPEFIAGPLQTISDIMSGKKTSADISGKEVFELGALFGNISAATGTGRGIAGAAGERAAVPAAEKAAPEAVAAAETAAAPAAAPVAPAAPVAAPAAAPVAAPAAPAAARGGLHSTEETLALRGASKELFKPLDEAGIVIKPESFRPLTQEIFSEAAQKGLDPTLTPGTTATIKRFQELADQPVTLQTLNTLREVASTAAGSKVPKDAMLAERIIDRLDNYLGNLKSKDLMLGAEADAQAIAQSIKAARATWAEASKLEVVSRLVQRAQDSVAQRPQLGLENVLRNEFTALAKNDKQMKKFTPEERAAVRQITRGATKATMRGLGRLAPTGPVSGAVTGGLAVGLGAKLGLDPMAAMLVIGTPAFAARKLAAVLTQRSVRKLEDVIRTRGDNGLANKLLNDGRNIGEQLRASLGTAATAQSAAPPQKRKR